MKTLSVASALCGLALLTATASAQVVVSAPVTTYYAPAPVVRYSAPFVTTPAVTTYYAPSAPVVVDPPATTTTYYAPATTTYYAPTTTYYAPATTSYYAPATTTYYAPSVVTPTLVSPNAYFGGDLYGRPTVYRAGRPIVNSVRYLLP